MYHFFIFCPTIIGLDDFAFRKGRQYGTLICDLQTRRPIAILPDHEGETVTQWLQAQQQITIVSRDGSPVYRDAIAAADAAIEQITDWWHLIENAHEDFTNWLQLKLPSSIQWFTQQDLATLDTSL